MPFTSCSLGRPRVPLPQSATLGLLTANCAMLSLAKGKFITITTLRGEDHTSKGAPIFTRMLGIGLLIATLTGCGGFSSAVSEQGGGTGAVAGGGANSFLSAEPGALSFEAQPVGVTSTPQTVTITNIGSGDATIDSVMSDHVSFAVSGPPLPTKLSIGESVQFSVTFTPNVDDSVTALLTIEGAINPNPLEIGLSGTGIGPAASLIPPSLNFGNQTVMSVSSPQAVTLSNGGQADLLVSNISILPSQFALVPGPPVPPPTITLTPGDTLTYAITFTPNAAQSFSGTLDFTTNDPAPTSVDLSGIGTTSTSVVNIRLQFNTSQLDFGSQVVGITSQPKEVIASNGGTAPVDIASITVSLPFAIDQLFLVNPQTGASTPVSTLPVTLQPGENLRILVTFTPSAEQGFADSLVIISNAPSSPDTVGLVGSGVTACPDPNTPPSFYCATTSTGILAEPPLPTLGPANSILTDPTFGSKILRVTDENTGASINTGFANRSFRTFASAEANTWNTDSTKFLVAIAGSGQIAVYTFDPATLSASLDTSISPAKDGRIAFKGGGSFSITEANIVYGFRTATAHDMEQYDFNTDTYSVLLDMDTQCPGLTLAGSDTMSSITNGGDQDADGQDDRLATSTGGPGQDRWTIVVIWDRANGCRWYNTINDQIGGAWGPSCTNCLGITYQIHNLRMSQDGRFVWIQRPGQPGVIWEMETTNIRICSNGCTGHRAWGVERLGTSGGPGGWLVRNANDPNNFTVIAQRLDRAEQHISWNNARPNRPIPYFADIYLPRDQTITNPHEGEILAIATDGSGTIWRFAHNRTDCTQGLGGSGRCNFWATPRGNISQDGRFFAFTSNWECTLPIDTEGNCRQDVFIVKLE